MCGIAGRVNTDPARPINRARLEAMTTAVAHRGPDADGFYVGAGVGLGHRRLSILDLATGDQPLSNEDGRFWVVFNGEIFNFADTRAELETAGHHFRTNTDTEVIVHAHEEWGDAAVERFRGMFAYALWETGRAGCCSSAIAWASSRSTTRPRVTRSSSDPKSSRFSRIPMCRAIGAQRP